MKYWTLSLLLFVPSFIATPLSSNRFARRDVTTTVYQPTTIYQTIIASPVEGFSRKTRKIHKHRHDVIKQSLQEFEDEVEEFNHKLDHYKKHNPGQAIEYTNDADKEGDSHMKHWKDNKYDSSYDDSDDQCDEDDEWCCEEGEEGCDEYEYEECNEGEEGCEEYDEDEDLIIHEIDFDIYIEDIDEYIMRTKKDSDESVHAMNQDSAPPTAIRQGPISLEQSNKS